MVSVSGLHVLNPVTRVADKMKFAHTVDPAVVDLNISEFCSNLCMCVPTGSARAGDEL